MCADMVDTNNLVVNGSKVLDTTLTTTDVVPTTSAGDARPTGVSSKFRANAYDADRANLAVYNWDSQASVTVSSNGFFSAGQGYKLYSPTDVFGAPLQTGFADASGSIAVAMNGAEFGAFVVKRGPNGIPIHIISDPVAGMAASGSFSGTTNFDVYATGGTYTFTAEASFTVAGTTYNFVEWNFNGGDLEDTNTTASYSVSGETEARAMYTAVANPQLPVTASGSGIISVPPSMVRATLFVDVQRDSGGFITRDVVRFSEVRPRVLMVSTGITSLDYTAAGGNVTINGTCTVNGAVSSTYTLVLTGPAYNSYSLTIAGSVSVSGTISLGGFAVTSP
jgi:hypothetical protein